MGASTRTYWPSMSDYQEAVQSPSVCFSGPELRAGTPVLTALGLPRPICGAFASVYELEKGGSRWAVKCFLRNIPDQHDRYAQISDHLSGCGLPYFVTFEYQQEGILVHGQKFPIVKMEWVVGRPLNEYIVANLGQPDRLRDLEDGWVTLLQDLEAKDIAHGDLQHGNVLVLDDGSLRLIDYDGMYVASLKGQLSHETGHADYQNPARSAKDFDVTIDGFAGTVIRVAIRALYQNPDLWQEYDNGENMLFKRRDFLDTKKSAIFAELLSLGDPEIDAGLDALKRALAGKKGAFPKPAKSAGPKAPAPAAKPVAKAVPKAPPAQEPVAKAVPKTPPPPSAPPPPAKPGAPGAGPSWLTGHVAPGAASPAASAPAAKPAAASKPAPAAKPTPAAKPAPAPKPARASRSKGPGPQGRVRRSTRGTRPSKPSGRPSIFRLVLHLIAGAPWAYLAFKGSMDVVRWGGAVVTSLGFISLATLVMLRGAHRAASAMFFGLTGVGVLGNTVFEICATGSYGTTKDDMVQYGIRGLLLLICALGMTLGGRAQNSP